MAGTKLSHTQYVRVAQLGLVTNRPCLEHSAGVAPVLQPMGRLLLLAVTLVSSSPLTAAVSCPAGWQSAPTNASWGESCYIVPHGYSLTQRECEQACSHYDAGLACVCGAC